MVLAIGLVGPAVAQITDRLVPLAQPGPWSAVSRIIGYDGRIWFANSVKFVNHNAADIYSFDPATRQTRYEQHLFSQDAGLPLVHNGMMYWPFEDPRASTGRGEFMVSDGRDWQWRVLQDGLAFHVHAMIPHDGGLVAASSAWRALLQRSDDGGATWRVIYDHPTSEGRVSRITSLASLDVTVFAGLTYGGDGGPKLLMWRDGLMAAAPNWPDGWRVRDVTVFDGWVYGINERDGMTSLWRTDGIMSERVGKFDDQYLGAMAAGARSLSVVVRSDSGGALWRSQDGAVWQKNQAFDGARPVDVADVMGDVYVGTIGPDGRGTLWGPDRAALAQPERNTQAAAWPSLRNEALCADGRGARAVHGLGAVLADRISYEQFGAGLRANLADIVACPGPTSGAVLSAHLARGFPDLQVPLFGARTVPAADIARWGLLWAIGMVGGGYVPPDILAEPWRTKQHESEKYLEAAPAAAWAIGRLAQSDVATIDRLLARLQSSNGPDWIKGDIVGALTAVTGQRFGYDIAAWQAWWDGRP